MALTVDKFIMERRHELRVTSDQTVDVAALGPDRRQMKGITLNMSGRGISIFVPTAFTAGDPVRVQIDDSLLLGEVCYCHPKNEGFVIGIEIDQVLNGLAALERLNRALRGEAVSYSMSEQV